MCVCVGGGVRVWGWVKCEGKSVCVWGGGGKRLIATVISLTLGKSGNYDNRCSGSNWIDSCDCHSIVAETEQVGGSECCKEESRIYARFNHFRA